MGSSTRYDTLHTIRPSIFGEILLCKDLHTQQQVVIKTVDLEMALKQTSKEHGVVKENVLKEVEVMSFLKKCGGHPNVMSMRDYFMTKGSNQLNVVLDYCEGGDLLDIGTSIPPMEPSTKMNDRTAFKYFRDVINGLGFLHSRGIAHRDLSLENILIRNGQAIIADFGLCAQREPGSKTFRCKEMVGKHYYMAPEVVAHTDSYDPTKADVWSVGISFFIFLTSSPPFEIALLKDPGFRYVAKHGLRAVFTAWGLDTVIHPALQDVLEQMTAIDPNQRPSVEEIQQHPVFKSMQVEDPNWVNY